MRFAPDRVGAPRTQGIKSPSRITQRARKRPKKKKPKQSASALEFIWWAMRDLNPRPCACKAPALPLRQSPMGSVLSHIRIPLSPQNLSEIFRHPDMGLPLVFVIDLAEANIPHGTIPRFKTSLRMQANSTCSLLPGRIFACFDKHAAYAAMSKRRQGRNTTDAIARRVVVGKATRASDRNTAVGHDDMDCSVVDIVEFVLVALLFDEYLRANRECIFFSVVFHCHIGHAHLRSLVSRCAHQITVRYRHCDGFSGAIPDANDPCRTRTSKRRLFISLFFN